MLISIQIEKTQPLTGTASSNGNGPVSFVGWMALLRVVAELTEATDEATDAGHPTTTQPTIQTIGNGSES
jgi:hypothetical protein